MPRSILPGIRELNSIASWGVIAFAVVSATPVLAQQSERDVPAGSFIFQRDVPTRAAEDPGEPGKPEYVVLGGKDAVFGALGIRPMSDAEQAQVTADLAPRGNVVSDNVNASLDVLASDRAVSRSALAGEQGGGYVGGAISGAMSAIPAAMGALRGALGSDR